MPRQVLRQTVYNGKEIRDGAESMLPVALRLTLLPFGHAPNSITIAAHCYLPGTCLYKSAGKGVNTDGFRYDLVDVTRQVLANYAGPLQKKWVTAYKKQRHRRF